MSVPGGERGHWRLPIRPFALVVPLVAALAGGAFLAWKPGVARSMLASPRALGFSLTVGVILLGLGWLLPRRGRGAPVTAGAQLVVVMAAFTLTVLPAFRDVKVEEPLPAAAPTATGPLTSSAPAAAQVVGAGSLRGIDHRASGRALLLRLADGRSVLRLEGLDVEPGPDYQVHLVPGTAREAPDGGLHLGGLRANKGDLTYPVPVGGGGRQPVTVLIWCRAFAVPVASATIA